MNISVKQLKALISLSTAGSFGRAAEALNITQPALSMQIKDLEAAIGLPLVERPSRGAILTAMGRDVLLHARRIIAELDEVEALARWQGGLAGRLTLGVIPTVAPYLLPQALPLLRAQDIAMDISIREAQTDVLLNELRAGDLDTVIVALPLHTPGALDGLVVQEFFEDEFLLGASADQARRFNLDRPDLHPEEMQPDRLLLLDEGHCLTDQTLAACSMAASSTHMDLRAASLGTLCRLVVLGFGLTLVPKIAVSAEQAASPGLVLFQFGEPRPQRQLALLRREQSVDDGWFTAMGDLLRTSAESLGANAAL